MVVKNSSRPVSVKIRAGWDQDSLNAKEAALYAQDAGITALFIHGRTKVQGYSGTVDYQVIKSVKEALEIPVIASGDILSAALAKRCSARPAVTAWRWPEARWATPGYLKKSPPFFKNGEILPRPDSREVIRIMLEHLDMCADFYGEKIGVVIFRKFIAWYTRGFRKIRPLREKASRVKTKAEILKLSADFLSAN